MISTGCSTPVKQLNIISCEKYRIGEPLTDAVELTGDASVYLKVDFNGAALQFYFAVASGQWKAVGPVLDGSILSDEYVCDEAVCYRPAFTGAFVGLCCQDLSGRGITADFDWFDYREPGGR